jgi:hypothetical protein
MRLDDGPNPQEKTAFLPSLKGAMDSAVITQFLRQLVPLGSAPQPINDAIEHLSGVCSFATSVFGGVHFEYDGFYHFPQLVRDFPDSAQHFLLLHIRLSSPSFWRKHISISSFVQRFEIIT